MTYPSFYKHVVPSHRETEDPVILLYFEELREVVRRQSEATVYYITADKIERPRNREGAAVVVRVSVVCVCVCVDVCVCVLLLD